MTEEYWESAVLAALEAERALPLGNVREASNRLLSPVSRSMSDAASNLLAKAVRALESGDDAHARRFVERALALPFDEHEELLPGWWEAHMFIYTSVAERLETCAAGDTSWLDVAEVVLDGADPRAAAALRESMPSLAEDHDLSPSELRRCRRLAGDLRPDYWNEHVPDDPTERVDVVMGVVALVLAYVSWPEMV
ncbi:MAG TPA: hypothetical protein VF661_08910 [Actinomycetales bacterium]|jgi:hypothetical protein